MLTFEEIVEKAKNFTKTVSKEDFLEFYGYYKQATVGDCNIEVPTDAEKKARYDAWKSKAGLTAEDAKKHYIEVYKKYAAKYQ
ncbi:acyl-CoA-binding protein [Drosophila grimshawi]|uniref:GH14516 n=1 Tax=Drosophila grimshawi TaxID=7222 RepID=B4IZI0_DROGR|nr:acyl-CoA-binding protein [Drosophila grimshawi]EDV97755.1 GH14516 [Drosophila grimshawi]